MDLELFFVLLFFVASTSQVSQIETLYTNGPGYSEYFPLQDILADGNTLRFSVRTSRDAHILLATSPERDQPEYEIVLGALNNTINFLRGRYPDHHRASSSVRTVNLLNQQEFRNLWIKLKFNSRMTALTIQIGIGEEKIPFQQWRDPEPLNVEYVSFRSETWAHWKYGYSDEGNTIGLSEHRKEATVTADESGSRYGQYHPLSEVVSHSDDASATLYFTVKTSNEFQILLSETASSSGNRYEFGLRRTSAYVRRENARTTGSSTQNLTQGYTEVSIPNDNSRLQYWIKLNTDGQVMLGKGGAVEPILFWHDSNPILPQFVAFTLIKEGANFMPASYAEIEYGLGPDYTIASQDCKPRWKDAVNQAIPLGAVIGGYTNSDELFICSADHADTVIPGSVFSGNEGKLECHVAWGVNVRRKTEFQVLTGCRFSWHAASVGSIPECAVTEKTGKTYVARVTHKNQVIIGKASNASMSTLYIAFENQELPFGDYEVLANCKA